MPPLPRPRGLSLQRIAWIALLLPCSLLIADPRFVSLPSDETGVSFRNDLEENFRNPDVNIPVWNGFMYQNYFQGGGVATGDFNGDGLIDLFFTSNQQRNRLYLNEGDFRFRDVTDLAGVAGKPNSWTTGVVMEDVNTDGRLDLYVCYSGTFEHDEPLRNELWINTGNEAGVPRFREAAAEFGLDDPTCTTHGAFLDYDRDGDLDFFMVNHAITTYELDREVGTEEVKAKSHPRYGDKFYRNDNGRFVDITEEAGVFSHVMGMGLAIAVSDFNDDGWPDIHIANDFSEREYLYINNRGGKFLDAGRIALFHTSNFSMGTDVGDINNDGLMDLMVLDMVAPDNYGIKTEMSGMNPERFFFHVEEGLHYQYMYNTLQLNRGVPDGKHVPYFSEIAHLGRVDSTYWSWAPLLADFDNDGWSDLYVTNGIKRSLRNNDYRIMMEKRLDQAAKMPGVNVMDVMHELGSAMPSIHVPNSLFQNQRNLTFADRADDWGMGEPSYSTGAAYADLDNDGDLDLVVNNIDAPAYVFRNDSRQLDASQNFLAVELKGPAANSLGTGARVVVKTADGMLTREMYPNRGFQSAVSPVLHFGLGEVDVIQSVSVRWADGTGQEIPNVGVNQRLEIAYNPVSPRPLPPRPAPNSRLFVDTSAPRGIDHLHDEVPFDDYVREVLLPHQMSNLGPGLAVGDINGDGTQDFFIGGGHGQAGAIYLQIDGRFYPGETGAFLADVDQEAMGAVFVDIDNDGDQDLYVVNGSNEFELGSDELLDRLYLNNGNASFADGIAVPGTATSGGRVAVADYDQDGDSDLLVTGRQVPGRYGVHASSILLRNDSAGGEIKLVDVSAELAPELKELGMATDVRWGDFNGDGNYDFVAVGEWMAPRLFLGSSGGSFAEFTDEAGLSSASGWWFSIEAADLDADGDLDFVAGNLGNNYKYRATADAPFVLYSEDLDGSGTWDIVLGYEQGGITYPLRGRQCSSQQIPDIKKMFPNYDTFAQATLFDVYGGMGIENSLQREAHTFSTTVFRNQGNGTFVAEPLGELAQVSSTNRILIEDFDTDGRLDLVLAGNLYGSEVETPRNDASVGLLVRGRPESGWQIMDADASGLYLPGDVKDAQLIRIGDTTGILAARNTGYLQLVELL